MRTVMKKFIEQYEVEKRKKSFELVEIQRCVVEYYGGQTGFFNAGGYEKFCSEIRKFEKEGLLKEVKASEYNGQNPPLKTRWKIVKSMQHELWSVKDILSVSDLLDIGYFLAKPERQTSKSWQLIKSIHAFLLERDAHCIASCEERCLELFGDEKFLRNKDNTILKKLDLSFEQLKMKKYGHMFTYWNRGVKEIDTVIILENHSTFFSFKRIVMEGGSIFGMVPDALIFGGGKRIIRSMTFLDEIAEVNDVRVFYFGDIDPEGYLIYRLLKEAYPQLNIKLLADAYSSILLNHAKDYPCLEQNRNPLNLNYIMDEFTHNNMIKEVDRVVDMWNRNRRIPQEVISYEYMKKLGEEYHGAY